MRKGVKICVEGKLVNRQYEDKDGITRYVTEVEAHEVLMLGQKKPA